MCIISKYTSSYLIVGIDKEILGMQNMYIPKQVASLVAVFVSKNKLIF